MWPSCRVSRIVREYISHLQRAACPHHVEWRGFFLDRFVNRFGRCRACRLSAGDVGDWIAAHPWSAWTKAGAAAAVRGAFNWAQASGLLDAHRMGCLRFPPGERRRPLGDDEFRAIVRQTRGRRGADFRRLLYFLSWTGCRPGEAAAIEWANVRFDMGAVILEKHKTARHGSARVIPLCRKALALLRWLRRRCNGVGAVFLNSNGRPWTRRTWGLRFARLRRKAGVSGASLYSLRHRFGTNAVLRGVDQHTLARLMGHTTTRMTGHYVHLAGNLGHLQEALERINRQPTTR